MRGVASKGFGASSILRRLFPTLRISLASPAWRGSRQMEASESQPRHFTSWDQEKAPSFPQRTLVARKICSDFTAQSVPPPGVTPPCLEVSLSSSSLRRLFPRFLQEPAMQRDGEGGETSAEKLHLDYWNWVAEVITPSPLSLASAIY